MDNQRSSSEQNGDTQYARVEDLQLDRVVASQPELGPTPPDGGYGWVIVTGGILYNLSVTTLLNAYGIINLYANEDNEYDDNVYKIWDQKIILVPIFCVIIYLLLESWCREMVKVFNMPRFMALAGICTTVAGVLLSSFGTYNDDSNQVIVNIFSGIFAGLGLALTTQQTEIIIKHYFRDKLAMVQTLIKLAPPLGSCFVPLFIAFLSSHFSIDRAILVYGIILLQNSIFLAAYSRPIYIVRMLKKTYRMVKDIDEDDDQEIFSRASNKPQTSQDVDNEIANETEDPNDGERVIATFNTQNTIREVMSPAVQMKDVKPPTIVENRFSSDFSTSMFANRFSSDFSTVVPDPEPLYRETTVVNELTDSSFTFAFDHQPTAGTERRTSSMQRNFISIMSMFVDPQFYLYTLLHMNTIYGILMLFIFLPCYMHQRMNGYDTWRIVVAVTIINVASFFFVLVCTILPKSLNKKARLCASFCAIGAIGFYGIALSQNRPFLILWGILASFATSSSNILKQPIYDDMINEFDATATSTAANSITALFLLLWTLLYNYQFKTCFETAAFLQMATATIFFFSSLKLNFILRR